MYMKASERPSSFYNKHAPWGLPAELSLTVHTSSHVILALWHPRNLGVLITLFQPEWADYAHRPTASTPGFENLDISVITKVDL